MRRALDAIKYIEAGKMTVNHIFIKTCQIIVLFNLIHGSVLFAANLDDFRSIAKKFIPDKMVDQLADIASKNSMKHRQQPKKVDKHEDTAASEEYSDEDANTEVVTKPAALRISKTTMKKRFAIKNPVTDIDFDKLVDKVRVKLEGEPKKKRIEHKKEEKSNSDERNPEELYKELIHKVDQIKKPPIHEDEFSAATQDTQIYDDDDVPEPAEKPVDDGMLLQEADLTKKKDSYEDYVMPNRDNIFESDSETKTTKMQRVGQKVVKFKGQRLKAVAVKEDIKEMPLPADSQAVPSDYEDKNYEEHISEEVKAKTSSLNKPGQKGPGKSKKLKGTMIPTRHVFKMSSPNYFGKLPAVAERYDFNEPLPESDREPEKFKYFGNPDARINKKVKVNK